MKKTLLMIILVAMGMAAMAQRPGQPQGHSHSQHGGHHQSTELTLTAVGNEQFVVYLDGDIVNQRPQRQVVLRDLPRGEHDIYVALEHPQKKITMMVYDARLDRDECQVRYSQRTRSIELTVSERYGRDDRPDHRRPAPVPQTMPMQPQTDHYTHCSDQEVDQMVAMLHAENFDSTREKLAMNFVTEHHLLANQILRLCREFTFENGKKDLMKKAYPYCVDPENYAIVTTVLTYSSDKEEILDFISSNKGR